MSSSKIKWEKHGKAVCRCGIEKSDMTDHKEKEDHQVKIINIGKLDILKKQ